MKKSLLIAFAIILSSQCFAQNEEKPKPDWIFLGRNSYDKTEYYLKGNYTSNDGSGIKIWVKSVHPSKKVKGITYKNVHVLNLYTIDCKDQEMSNDQQIIYSSSNRVLENTETYLLEFSRKTVIPGTVGEMILNKTCELFNN